MVSGNVQPGRKALSKVIQWERVGSSLIIPIHPQLSRETIAFTSLVELT